MKYISILLLLCTVIPLSSCQKENIEVTKEIHILQQPVQKEEKKIILALGDSLTAGYGLDITDSYPYKLEKKLANTGYNYTIINAGVSGDTSLQAYERLDLYLENTGRRPDMAIIVIGGNDGLRGTNIEKMTKNIENIIDTLKEKDIQVILPSMQIPPNLGLQYSHDFKNAYAKIAEHKDVYLAPFFLEGVAGNSGLNLPDGIHPTSEGYDIIVETIFTFLIENNLINND